MNGEILILSIVKDRTAGVTKTPELFPSMISNVHLKVLRDKYQRNNLLWYSQSKSKHMNVNDMDPMYIKNCLNLLITGQGQWKAPLTSVAESIRQAWITMFAEELIKRSK